MTIGNFYIDFSGFLELADKPPWEIFAYFLLHGGWVLYLVVIAYGSYRVWLHHKQHAYMRTIKMILLAINVPKSTEQTLRAVESFFTAMAGAHHGTMTLWELYGKGKSQEGFAVEIVSFGGQIRFFVYTPAMYRDLIEAALYAQYPDAEIEQVEDYTAAAPKNFPNPEYELWGTEMINVQKDVYPLRTYKDFEDTLAGELKDPLAALLELMGRIGPGEQIWYQIIVEPINDKWKKRSEHEVKKLIGAEVHESRGLHKMFLGEVADLGGRTITTVGNLFQPPVEAKKGGGKEKPPSMMMHMSPGQKDIAAAIENKMTKIGFKSKMRVIYWARKEVFRKTIGASGMIGAIKQFNTVHLNALKPNNKRMTTKVHYVFVKFRTAYRQRRIMRNYTGRSNHSGVPPYVLNIEELATMWHFPVVTVKAPLVQKSEAKKAEPPFRLPVVADEAVPPKARELRNLPLK